MPLSRLPWTRAKVDFVSESSWQAGIRRAGSYTDRAFAVEILNIDTRRLPQTLDPKPSVLNDNHKLVLNIRLPKKGGINSTG